MSSNFIFTDKNADSIAEAKKRLIFNVSTNIAQLFVTAVAGLWLTPFLISSLGVAVYGLIPLMTSIAQYFSLITLAITATVGRFVAINYAKGDYQTCSRYYSTSLFILSFSSIFLAFIALFISFFFANIFDVPKGHEFQSSVLFLLIISSTIITVVTSPFQVSTFVKHRFDLQNISRIVGKLLQISVIIVCFCLLKPKLEYVGLSYLLMTLCILYFSVIFTKKLTPEFKLSAKFNDRTALKDMLGMGVWATINQLGALLYLSIDMIIINLFLGSTKCGRYAPVVQWSIMLNLLCGAVSGVLTPIFYELIGKDDIDQLTRQLQRSIRFMSALMILPISLLCGFSRPLLNRWLGNDFAEYHLLMWILIAPAAINMVVRPVFAVFRGKNKVKVPAIATIIGGISNLILSSILVNTPLGIYGVAISTLICLLLINSIFTPIYTAKILKQLKSTFYIPIMKSVLMFSVLSFLSYIISRSYDLHSYFRLILASAIVALIYLPFLYFFLLKKTDRTFLVSLLGKTNSN